jgi:hypothetical protein
MAGLTKTERNRIHKVLERDNIRKQFRAEGLKAPPLLDPDVLGRGPGTGPAPRGADEGDEELKPSAAEVARQTLKTLQKRQRQNVPATVLDENLQVPTETVKVHGETVKPPRKSDLDAITDKKIAGREVNERGPYSDREQAKAVAAAQPDSDEDKPGAAARRSAKTSSADTEGNPQLPDTPGDLKPGQPVADLKKSEPVVEKNPSSARSSSRDTEGEKELKVALDRKEGKK